MPAGRGWPAHRSNKIQETRPRRGDAATGPASGGGIDVDALLDEARAHAQRLELEAAERCTIAELARPTYELPLLPHGVDLGGIYRLAAALREQGAA